MSRLRTSLCLLLGILCLGQARAQVQEPALKAAFVYNFILFTTWPESRLDGSGELRLCIDARHALAPAIADLHGKPVGERRIGVRPLDEAAAGRCHVAVVGPGGPRAEPALPPGDRHGLLTISDGGTAGGNGAAIVLVREDSRVRFEVDGARTAGSGLALSSRLLRLARRVL